MMRRTSIFTLFSLCGLVLSASCFAQSLADFKSKLSQPDSLYHSRITIVEYSDAAVAIRAMQNSVSAEDKIKGYRVRIFFDNSQNARSLAATTLSRFNEFFPDVPTYMTYDNPYWKVTVGNCISAEEAITLWGRVKNSFDRAFVIRETVQISTLSE